MPLAKLRPDYETSNARPAPRSADGATAIASPARILQDRIERHAQLGAMQDIEKWSPRRTLAFIVVTTAALWAAIIAGAAQAIHAIA
ncbi:hypothetical protein [Sphingomonas nostoxanthinifaciens]|uniref:hypothetical protein n=1 Tax=Sphingomonas nostoxanthinifaciens TaxID=2872652 RepID=UPI001CC21983|nr:hypothetical protein [Sphingomonas nostoxanthinifaciens]UAK22978.1 hypothetical protein K8P63_11090 [Sphingomonas nostoxanthinifaciens]